MSDLVIRHRSDTAKALRVLMTEYDVSVREVAAKYDCSTTHIYRLLDEGARRLDTVERLSAIFNIKPSQFLQAGQPK